MMKRPAGNPPPTPPGDAAPQLRPSDTPTDAPQPLAPEDFYYEGPYIVFTESYHRKRGYCCNSGCRHCPFR